MPSSVDVEVPLIAMADAGPVFTPLTPLTPGLAPDAAITTRPPVGAGVSDVRMEPLVDAGPPVSRRSTR